MKHYLRTLLVILAILALCLMPSEELDRIDLLEISFQDFIAHLLMFAGFTFVFLLDLKKSSTLLSFWKRAYYVAAISLTFGVVTEFLQYLLVFLNRSASLTDWIFDVAGTAAGIGVVYLKERLHGPVI